MVLNTDLKVRVNLFLDSSIEFNVWLLDIPTFMTSDLIIFGKIKQIQIKYQKAVLSVNDSEISFNLKAIDMYNWVTTFSCRVLYLMSDISTFLAANQLNELRELKYIHTFAIQ